MEAVDVFSTLRMGADVSGRDEVAGTGDTGFALLFRYPQYGKLWLGNVISGFGDQAGWIALVWFLLHRTGSAASIGWVTLLYQLPSVVTSFLAGVLLDRFPRARVMAVGNFILGILFGLVVWVSSLTGPGTIWLIYGLIGLAGIVVPLNITGGGVLLPELIPSEKLSQANYLMQMEWQVALVLGPAVGGVLIAIIGSQVLILADAVTFFAVGIILLTLRHQTPVRKRPKTNSWQDFREGIAFLLHREPLWALVVLTVFFNLLYGPYEVLLPVTANRVFHSATVLGMWWTAFAVGSVAGSVVLSFREWRYNMASSLASIIILWGCITVGVAFSRTSWLTGLLMLTAGLIYSPWGAWVMTIRQKMIPGPLQGRVLGASQSLIIAATPIGTFITGLFLSGIPAETIFLVCGVGTVVVGLIALWWPSFREIQ